ncbi:2-dehydropantoate 2-reductase [Rhodospirillaceae bacterium SYSU D60014]|uniref:2-dehydropantoate 2-reductase n=1 Tax=Virgifigura deserti TaxID=2268457 RepID=UPI000E65FB96
MRFLILGAGAVGGYFGGRLAESGADVTFLVREARAALLNADGLAIRSAFGNAVLQVAVLRAGAPMPTDAGFDVILLCCKAYDLPAAMAAVAPAVGPDSAVLPLLNGLAHLDALQARFGADRVLGGLCQIAATLSPAGEILHLNRAHNLVFGELDGQRTERVERLGEIMGQANFRSRPSDTIGQEMWEKFVMLATLAGMTCLMRASVGAIMATEEGERLMLEFLDECATVAAAAGYAPRSTFLTQSRELLTARGSTFTASMLRDIERGGPVEGEHVLGDLLRRASRLGVPTPLLRVAVCHLQAYESRNAATEDASPAR